MTSLLQAAVAMRPRFVAALFPPGVRRLSTRCFPLSGLRGLLRLRGPGSASFLQGLVTNDVEQLKDGAMYAHLLNVQGRSLFDVIVYRVPGQGDGSHDLLMECDAAAVDSIHRHLQVYNFRKKVDVHPCPELSVWAFVQKKLELTEKPRPPALFCAPDPRGPVMGSRVVAPTGQDIADILPGVEIGTVLDYIRHRYQHGVPEGVKDLPPGEALPLESNLVYMNGISFSKGCYIGQELTARTHHTGVIRKRLVPLHLSSPLPPEAAGAEVTTASGKSAGKYRAGVDHLGLVLIRLVCMKEELHITAGGGAPVRVTPSLPAWWPPPGDGA